jgi:hypothetical protein
MLCAARLAGRFSWSRRRFAAAARLIRGSRLEAIPAAYRRGTSRRIGHGESDRNQQSDYNYSQKAHGNTLLPRSGTGNY